MPRQHRSLKSGYERIAQREEEEEEHHVHTNEEHEDPFEDPLSLSVPDHSYEAVQPKRRPPMRMASSSGAAGRLRRSRANSGVDIKAINVRLERWAEEIKQRFKRRGVKGKSAAEEKLEIHHSVFQAPEWIRAAGKQSLETDYDDSHLRLSKIEFDDIVESVRTAIELGMQPKLISQGSSGSYFARNSGGKIVGVFKPKDEEPYASKNPKWTKWIHRNLFPFAFGRACLIPNLSYVSEAAAYVLDVQLRTNLVPYTEVVSLSSKSFFYDFWDRRSYYRKKKPLPEKQGSFQVFLKGYKGATEFFREHPWPENEPSSRSQPVPKKRRKRRRWTEDCRPGSTPKDELENESDDEQSTLTGNASSRKSKEFWTESLQQSFREQLERLVILDYIMRNTDRGTDNWMIHIDRATDKVSIVADRRNSPPGDATQSTPQTYHRRNESMNATPPPMDEASTAKVGAIDNSLSWPWKHPDAWRSYPFGWLFLPVGLIGRPFSEKTRNHFLPLLTSKDWWSETQVKLRATFEIDVDFKERMFARQMAVMKGQAWNVVETLKTPDHGPLELTRRSRVCVWDDIVDIPVAIPMKRASEEMRRLTAQMRRVPTHTIAEEEEMDISAARESTSDSQQPDLLGLMSPISTQSGDNPFNYTRQSNTHSIPSELSTPRETKPNLASASSVGARRPKPMGARLSYDGAVVYPHASPPTERKRRFSFNVGRRNSLFVDDEDSGDLGYAAANDLQNVTRRVIVERLEMVKGKPPVFTWC